MWHSDQSDEEADLVASVYPGAPLVLGGTTVGTRAMSVGSALGYRRFRVLGMDCSFGDRQHAGVHPNPSPDEIEVVAYGRTFRTTSQLVLQVQDFFRHVAETMSYQFVIQGEGLLQHICSNVMHSRVRVGNARKVRRAA